MISPFFQVIPVVHTRRIIRHLCMTYRQNTVKVR